MPRFVNALGPFARFAGQFACLLAIASGTTTSTLAARIAPARASVAPGAAIYLHGLLPSGAPVQARREGELQISGAEAACINCHRRSGMGELEGSIKIPPISGRYLFRARTSAEGSSDSPLAEGLRERDSYTEATLARAIREGMGADGKALNFLMPRYSLSDGDMDQLIAYLKALTPSRVPGVDGAAVHFATIVTPDANPVKRQAMLDVLNQYFIDQNGFALAESANTPSVPSSRSSAKRRWQLHVWELSGPPAGWSEQLAQRQAREPVYAVISGIGGENWAPVHEFCEQSSLPCIFPNLELPVVAERDFYSLYFTRGVLLEAGLVAQALSTGTASTSPRRLVQVFRAADVGEAGAAALHSALTGSRVQSLEEPIDGKSGPRQLAALLKNVGVHDALMLWLRPADLAALASISPPSAHVFMSGLMGGMERAPLPPRWRPVTQMSYPADLPNDRSVRVQYAFGWMSLHHIPVVAEQVQVDTYVACSVLLETLSHMPGSFAPDYLVERMEGMLEHQLISGYYPRLGLAPNERFASKGGYLVHFAAPAGTRVLSDTPWVIP